MQSFSTLLARYSRILSRCFNWKVALLSAVNRGTIFFAVSLVAGWREAAGALAVEFAFRGVTSGLDGALSEVLCDARPGWLAAALIAGVIPLAENALEYVIHWSRGTQNLSLGAGVSLAVTALCALFNWYAMRQGVLLTAKARQSFAADLRSLPATVAGFLLVVPRVLSRLAAAPPQSRPAESDI